MLRRTLCNYYKLGSPISLIKCGAKILLAELDDMYIELRKLANYRNSQTIINTIQYYDTLKRSLTVEYICPAGAFQPRLIKGATYPSPI